jgi:voltage-gated potassium channel
MAQRRFNRRISAQIERTGGITAGVAVQIIAVYTMTVVFVSALIMWLIDDDNFPNYGVSLWWAVQTVTTVGYGDVVPTSIVGRVVAALVMLTGIGLITVVAGAVASGLAQTVARRRGMDVQERLREEIEAIHRRLDEMGAPPRD